MINKRRDNGSYRFSPPRHRWPFGCPWHLFWLRWRDWAIGTHVTEHARPDARPRQSPVDTATLHLNPSISTVPGRATPSHTRTHRCGQRFSIQTWECD